MADQATEGLLSPFLKRQRISTVAPYLEGRVLDVGCGNGALVEHVDAASVEAARANNPACTFFQTLRLEGEAFDTVAALAVIEHVSAPVAFLASLKENLKADSRSRILCTTPHPSMDWIHWVGSRIGLFSPSANEEHEDLLGRGRLAEVGKTAGLKVIDYRRFLFGANQMVVYGRDDL